jgi:enoyl-[acyl-carrier protein] reductase I
MAAQRVFPIIMIWQIKAYLGQLPQFWILWKRQKKLELILFPITNSYKAGQAVKGFNGFIAFADKMAPLGNTSAFRLLPYG